MHNISIYNRQNSLNALSVSSHCFIYLVGFCIGQEYVTCTTVVSITVGGNLEPCLCDCVSVCIYLFNWCFTPHSRFSLTRRPVYGGRKPGSTWVKCYRLLGEKLLGHCARLSRLPTDNKLTCGDSHLHYEEDVFKVSFWTQGTCSVQICLSRFFMYIDVRILTKFGPLH